MVKTKRILRNFNTLLEFNFRIWNQKSFSQLDSCFDENRTAFAANQGVGIYSRKIWRILEDSCLLLNGDIISHQGCAPTSTCCHVIFYQKNRSVFEFQSVRNLNLAKVKDAKKGWFGTEVATRWSCCGVFLQPRQIRGGGRPLTLPPPPILQEMGSFPQSKVPLTWSTGS